MEGTNTDTSSKERGSIPLSCTEDVSQDEINAAKPQCTSPVTRTLPNNIWTNILEQYVLGDSTISQILLLRRVSPWFSDEILSILCTRQLLDLSWTLQWQRVPLEFTVSFVQGFFTQRKLSLKSHKQMRRAMLRAAGLDPRFSNAAEATCLTLKSKDPCLRQIVGPSSGITCNLHDMLEAIALALGNNVFNLGCSNSNAFVGSAITDERYWKLLTIFYQVSKDVKNEKLVPQLWSLLQDLFADKRLDEEERSNMICDCFVLAARTNNAKLIEMLYAEHENQAELLGKLGKRFQAQNALLESIRLGSLDAQNMLVSKKWEFVPDVTGYSTVLSLIIRQRHFPAKKRALMLKSIFDWTNTWRNTNVIETLLSRIGEEREPELLEAVVSALKSQHYFRHEEDTNAYHGPPAQPLWSLAHHDNPVEMIRSFFDNKHLLLPRMKEETYKEMRMQTLQLLFADRTGENQKCQASTEGLKIIIEHSEDLVEAKHGLQNIICQNCNKVELEKWDWLAKEVRLDSKCDEKHDGHTLGSALMEEGVKKLNVEMVRFLVENGVGLSKEATTSQVEEDDEERMEKLETITKLLAQGGQGECTQKRTVTTTFSASRVEAPKAKRRSATDTSPIIRISSAVARMAHAPRPRSVKRKSISKRYASKSGTKSSSIVSTQSVSSGSSVTG